MERDPLAGVGTWSLGAECADVAGRGSRMLGLVERRIVARSLALWIGFRTAIGVVSLLAGQQTVLLTLPAATAVVAIVAGLTMWYGQRLNELLYLANGGTSGGRVLSCALLFPLTIECILQIVRW